MKNIRKTKIICTIGPASDNEDVLRQLMHAGMNVARLNFSHDTHAQHKVKADLIKRVRAEEGLPVALLLDTRGPEVRTGDFEGGKVEFLQGSDVWIRHEDILGNAGEFSVTYKDLHKDLKVGDRVLIDDGLLEMVVREIKGQDIRCEVMNGGPVSNHKSVNFPNVEVALPALTEKDTSDIIFAAEQNFDFIAVSFTRTADDIMSIRRVLAEHDGQDIMLIAKIENRQGIDNFDEILEAADGIMVARGDLGVEVPAYEVPTLQKMMIDRCARRGKPCVIATQMLDSMIRSPRPTRAEVSDVANAVYDGAAAIMLSGETANGKYPVQALSMMRDIALYTEAGIDYWEKMQQRSFDLEPNVTHAVSHACCTTAKDLHAGAIVAVTHSGQTARQMSRFRPACPIIAATVGEKQQRQLALCWGTVPHLVPNAQSTDEVFATALKTAKESGLVEDDEIIVISGGIPVGMSGTTNTLRVTTVNEANEQAR